MKVKDLKAQLASLPDHLDVRVVAGEECDDWVPLQLQLTLEGDELVLVYPDLKRNEVLVKGVVN